MSAPEIDRKLSQALLGHNRRFDNRYTDTAKDVLLDILFRALTNDRQDYLANLFPNGFPTSYSLREAQGAEEEPEYTEAARGRLCGHILKPGEATYHCATCTTDPTAVLCSRCWDASNHEDHQFAVSMSGGNSGCCDCGDDEAWKHPIKCAIHSLDARPGSFVHVSRELPQDLVAAVRTTVSRVLDFFCDVISCAPENLRLPKSKDGVQQDERQSRLLDTHYGRADEVEAHPEYCLVMWNDEKHTITEVQHQVMKACRTTSKFGLDKAGQAHDHGRSILSYSRDIDMLLRQAKIIEHIKITVTVRSARDTFREQMCGTIVEWLDDIAACSIMGDASLLRDVICEEMLHVWRIGSGASNAKIGRQGLDDHEREEFSALRPGSTELPDPITILLQRNQQVMVVDEDDLSTDDEDDDDMPDLEPIRPGDRTIARFTQDLASDGEEMDTDGDTDFPDANETLEPAEDVPPPPPPPIVPQAVAAEPVIATGADDLSRPGSEATSPAQNPNFRNIPKTPTSTVSRKTKLLETSHWRVGLPIGSNMVDSDEPAWKDLKQNIRLDSMVLFDLRLWKSVRTSLRELLITTVINVPRFKRILAFRFAGLYTTLAQLFLVADREPDHSILHVSVQLLTTPSIAEEVVESANFLTVLIAILYTYLTTRQVGFPEDVDPGASLGFDAGSVSNRRLYQFFNDLRYFLATPAIKSRMRAQGEYLLQFLDLAKLSQGICPNVRAVGEHVEYETDAWISAQLLIREINKLCKQITEPYQPQRALQGPDASLKQAINKTLKSVVITCSGLEHQRFEQSEIKELVKFHMVGPYANHTYKTVNFRVEQGTLSFHHPLHYTLSWLLENGKDSGYYIGYLQEVADDIVRAFRASTQTGHRFVLPDIYQTGEDALMAVFDYPLRVCAWLAQMRANMWVRNGMSLRHQMNQYKGVNYRDMGYYRDLFLLQTALVSCTPERVLASIIDRFGLNEWIRDAEPSTVLDPDHSQQLDIAEDFVYLLINLLSDRDLLCAHPDDPASEMIVLRKDIAHTLCFKPLSYTDLTNRLTERAENHPQLQKVIAEMTNFKAPEGLHDSGAFELKPEFLQELDPYNSHFSKNQRDEAENIYKKWAAKKLNKSADDIVLEPKLHPIKSVAYKSLPNVIHQQLFTITLHALLAQVIALCKSESARIPQKAESLLHTVLHLLMIASMEDNSPEADGETFIRNAIKLRHGEANSTVLSHLHTIWTMEDLSSTRSKIKHILRIFHKKKPSMFNAAAHDLDFDAGRFDTASPAVAEQELEAKKKQAMERKAKIMAQMQQQQQNFMDKQGVIDWGEEDMSDTESEIPTSTETRHWKAPSGVCIQCREETNDTRLYGTFAMVTNAHLLRVTPTHSVDHIMEVLASPPNLDQSIEESRPFGVAGNNLEKLRRFAPDGSMSTIERRGLSAGWPKDSVEQGLVSTSCGHFMHYACFENYYKSIDRRHVAQISRCQPERTVQNEFVCPLCKALANAFLPVSQKSTEQSYPSVLQTESSFEFFLEDILPASQTAFENIRSSDTAMNDMEAPVHATTIGNFTTNALVPFARALSEQRELPKTTGMLEMDIIYKRLKETIDLVWKTQIETHQAVEYQSRIIGVLANSVSAVEIAHRGRDDNSTCLIDHIAAQTLSHLQVLSQSVLAGAATMATVGNTGHSSTPLPLRQLYEQLADELYGQSGRSMLAQDGFTSFVGMSLISSRMQSLPVAHLLRVCLTQEILRVAIWWLQFGAPAVKTHAANHPGELKSPSLSREEYSALGGFVYWLTTSIHGERIQPLLPVDEVAPLYTALRAYALAFMRKAALFLHVAHGVDFPDATAALAGKPELDRLLSLTKLPDLTTILSSFSEFTTETALPNLAQRWIRTWTGERNTRHAQSSQLLAPRNTSAASLNPLATISLDHPTPFELVGLPEHYDTLIAEAQKRRCPTTGKEIVDAALCLFCGEIFCSQAVCCMHDGIRGGCNHHIETCSAPIGMFLFIRKCNIVFLDCRKDPRKIDRLRAQQARERDYTTRPSTESSSPPSPTSDGDDTLEDRSITPTPGEIHSPATTIPRFVTPSDLSLNSASSTGPLREADITDAHGAFFAAPYLTKHGETDQGLRTRQQLVLSKKRYDRLVRDAWLCVNGSVWSAVARKLEGESNAGGWETL